MYTLIKYLAAFALVFWVLGGGASPAAWAYDNTTVTPATDEFGNSYTEFLPVVSIEPSQAAILKFALVDNETQAKLPDALVYIDTQPPRLLTTDPDGRVVLVTAIPGDYFVAVYIPNFAITGWDVTLELGKTKSASDMRP
jgi:hypothetical protein